MMKFDMSKATLLFAVFFYQSWNSFSSQYDISNNLSPAQFDSTDDIISSITHFSCTLRKKPLLQKYDNRTPKRSQLYLAFLLIIHSSDVECNPGPRQPKYPCQICSKAVTWAQKGVACDDCEKWYHTTCMGMSDNVYSTLRNISWHCCNCGMPNFNTSLFESSSVNTQNSFQTLDSSTTSPVSNSSFDIGQPQFTSSPISSQPQKKRTKLDNVRVLIVNFQSVKNKTAEIGNLIDSADPDIIIGNETWLNNNIHSSEVFPDSYQVIRKDREDGYGGVLLAIKNIFTIEEIRVNSNIEAVFAKITLTKNQTLIVGSLYRPPSSSHQYIEEICQEMKTLAPTTRKP